MPEIRLQVRQSHTISNAAVGSLVQIGNLSLVPCDIRDWGDDGEDVDMPRLSDILGATFRKAPVREKRGDVELGGRIPAVRFPKWMYCPKCRKMYYFDSRDHGRLEDPVLCSGDKCEEMRSALAPMPWVVICANGHLDDVPWHQLAHREARQPQQKTCQSRDALYFVSARERDARLQVECRSCHVAFPLTALKAPELLVQVKCLGRQPWLYSGEECDKILQVAALGDHFVHYPVTVSALDIPPESRLDPKNNLNKRIREHTEWRRLLELHEKHGKENHVVQQKVQRLSLDTGCRPDAVWQLLSPANRRTEGRSADSKPLAESHLLREEEYRALLDHITDYREYERFITVSRTDEWQAWLKRHDISSRDSALGKSVAQLVGVTRLREVSRFEGIYAG